MITKEDLEASIKECEGQRSPNANTALKLAAFYTIKKELFPEKEQEPSTIERGYSYAPPPDENQNAIDFESSSEFGAAIIGKDSNKVLRELDNILSSLYVINPSLYRQIIRNLSEV